MTKHPGTPRKEGEERKGRRKERERERKGEERKVFPATNNRPGTHPRKRGVILSIQENPRKQRKNGGGKGEKGGLSARQVPMNLEQTSVAATTYGLPRGCHL